MVRPNRTRFHWILDAVVWIFTHASPWIHHYPIERSALLLLQPLRSVEALLVEARLLVGETSHQSHTSVLHPFFMNPILAFIEGVGGPELMMIMFIVLLLFGANKMPELAKGLGKSVREFKKAASGVEDEIRRALDEPREKPSPPALPAPPTLETSQPMSSEKQSHPPKAD